MVRVPIRRRPDLQCEDHSPEDIKDADESKLARLLGTCNIHLDAPMSRGPEERRERACPVEASVGLERPLWLIVRLDRWDGAACLVGVVGCGGHGGTVQVMEDSTQTCEHGSWLLYHGHRGGLILIGARHVPIMSSLMEAERPPAIRHAPSIRSAVAGACLRARAAL